MDKIVIRISKFEPKGATFEWNIKSYIQKNEAGKFKWFLEARGYEGDKYASFENLREVDQELILQVAKDTADIG